MELKVITYDHSVFTIFTREVTLLSLDYVLLALTVSITELLRLKKTERI